jgi:hypothetical protein
MNATTSTSSSRATVVSAAYGTTCTDGVARMSVADLFNPTTWCSTDSISSVWSFWPEVPAPQPTLAAFPVAL